MKSLALLAGCLLASSCGPRLIYYGHDPRRESRLEVIDDGGEQFVRYGGKEQAHYRGIGIGGITLSEDGQHLAYPARRKGSWLVVRDEREESAWDGIGPLLWSQDGRHLAYAARRNKTWQVVLDGRAGAPWDAILAGTLALSADGAHHAYAAARGKTAVVVHDGQPGPEYDGISRLALRAEGTHLSYLARRQARAYVSCDGVPSGPYQMVAELVQEAGGQCAFIAKQASRWRVFSGPQELGVHDSAAGLTLSSTGELAYVARQGAQERVVRRGVAGLAYKQIEWRSLVYSADGQHLAYVAQTGAGALVVSDGVPGPPYAQVQGLIRRGEHLAYIAVLESGGSGVVVDEKLGPIYPEVADLQLSPDGTRAVYLAQKDGRSLVVTPQGEYAFPLVLPGSVAWSRDGQRWGCLAGPELRSLRVIIDGKEQESFAMAEYYHELLRTASPTASDNSSLLRVWVTAELERPRPERSPL